MFKLAIASFLYCIFFFFLGVVLDETTMFDVSPFKARICYFIGILLFALSIPLMVLSMPDPG